MITIIIFVIGVLVTFLTSFLVLINTMIWWHIALIALAAIAGMLVINALIATICCKWIPKKWYKKDYNVSKKECKFYEKLGIKKWKDKTLDLGALNGFKKDKIVNTPEYVERFILENNMGYVEHLINAIVSVFAIFILPINLWLPMGLPIVITSVIINVMSVMILRYNMPRLKVLLKFSERNTK